jgi:N-acetyl-beta-hexosaminidase
LIKQITSLPSEEGYLMTITGDKIEISATVKPAYFTVVNRWNNCWRMQEILKKPVPSCTITDYPVLSYRAVHFDVKHHLDHMNYYYESIDRLARYKINAVVFEFEDKLRYNFSRL